ncbi:helix-turn-helix domain-containing protein [Paenibacillus sp. CC-CFT747]|nr:helix-turn-helix domain-containing protein [Paenibacillus sp. CC-CFT747]
MPFQAYLQHLRLTFAVSLLSASRLTITEVCHISGFQTLTHFERVFKSRYGVSPRRYQKRRTLPDRG